MLIRLTNSTFSVHETDEIKVHLYHQKCAKTHVRQSET